MICSLIESYAHFTALYLYLQKSDFVIEYDGVVSFRSRSYGSSFEKKSMVFFPVDFLISLQFLPIGSCDLARCFRGKHISSKPADWHISVSEFELVAYWA